MKKGIILKFSSFLVTLGLLGFFIPPGHEDAHAKINEAFGGGRAIIESVAWGFGGKMCWVEGKIPETTWPVYLAGGLAIFFFCLVSWIWFRYSKTLWDFGDEMAVAFWGVISLFYALSEVTLAFDPHSFSTVTLVLVSIGIILIALVYSTFYFQRLKRWINEEEDIVHIEGKKRIIQKIIGIFYFLTVVAIMAPRLNVWIQDVLVEVLGGQSSITYVWWFGLDGEMIFIQLPIHHTWLVSAAGIILCGLFLIIWFFAYKSPSLWDTHKGFAFAVLGAAELGYGGTKLTTYFFPQWNLETLSIVLPICLAALVVILYIPKLKKWITTTEIINRRID